MKTLTALMTAHINRDVTTLTTLWRVTRRDGTVIRVAGLDRDVRFGGQTYSAANGFARTATASKSDMSVDNTEVAGLLTDLFDREDVIAGRYDFARVEVFLVNWQAPDRFGAITMRRGFLGEALVTDDGFRIEVRGLTQALARQRGHVYQVGCRVDLFSPLKDPLTGQNGCGLDPDDFDEAGTVDTVTSGRVFNVDPGLTVTAGFFNGGHLRFTTGANAGISMEIKTYADPVMTLHLPLPYGIAPGDAFVAYPGCDKSIGTCSTKFANAENFQGEPHVPGEDVTLQYADSSGG